MTAVNAVVPLMAYKSAPEDEDSPLMRKREPHRDCPYEGTIILQERLEMTPFERTEERQNWGAREKGPQSYRRVYAVQ